MAGKPESGIYLVGELLSHAPRSYKGKDGVERSRYRVDVLVGSQVYQLDYPTEADARAVLGSAELRSSVSLRVIPLVKNSARGPWLTYIGLGRAAA